MILSLLMGGIIGGIVGFLAGNEEGHGGKDRYEMYGRTDNGQVDTRADGETKDDQSGAPNSDERTSGQADRKSVV